MENLKIGDILICRGHSLISKLIMKFTKSKWSHTCLYVETWNQPSIIEAQKNGVNAKPFYIWKEKWGYEYKVFRYRGSFDEKELMIKAFSKCGETKYDFWKLLVRQPRKLLFGKWKDKGEKEDDKMICSEYTGWVWDLLDWSKMTPDDQEKYLSVSPSWVEVIQNT